MRVRPTPQSSSTNTLPPLGVVAVGGVWLSLGQGDCPPTLHVSEDNRTGDEAVTYTTLPEKQQTQFRRAPAEGYTEIPKNRDTWAGTPGVRYQGQAYTTGIAVC